MKELSEINETLRNIERKIEDKSPYSFRSIFDWSKTQEEARKDREEKRNEELLKIQRESSNMMKVQTESIKTQEKFNFNIVLTYIFLVILGGISVIVQIILNFEKIQAFPLSNFLITAPLGFIMGASAMLLFKLIKKKNKKKFNYF